MFLFLSLGLIMTVTTTLNAYTTGLTNYTHSHHAVHAAGAKAAARAGCAVILSILALATGIAGVAGALLVSPYFALLCIASVLLAAMVAIILCKVKVPVYHTAPDTPIIKHVKVTREEVRRAFRDAIRGTWETLLASRTRTPETSEPSTPSADSSAPLSPISEVDTETPLEDSPTNEAPLNTTLDATN